MGTVTLTDGRVISTAMNPAHPDFELVRAWYAAHPGETIMKPDGFNERGDPYRSKLP